MDGLRSTHGKRVDPKRLRETVAKRSDALEILLEEPMAKPRLVERLATSRSTVDRAISELEGVGGVTRIDSAYHPTTSAALAFSEYQNYVSTTRTLAEGSSLLEAWPEDSPISVALIRDAEVHTANSNAPENALTPVIEAMKTASRTRVLMPVVLSTYRSILETFVEENDLEVEIVVEDEVLDSFEDSYWSAIGELETAGGVSVYTSGSELPFALWLIGEADDECAGVTVHERGGIRGVILNESPDAVEWASRHYERYRSDARLLES